MSKEFFNLRAATWDEKVSERDTRKLESMAGRLGIKAGSVVLDIGTGTGVFVPYLLARVGSRGRIVAVDFAEAMLKIARGKDFKGNIEYLCADVLCIPAPRASFDAVVCYSSFPHFPDKPGALAEMKRVMKSGARLSICHTSGRHHINHIHSHIPEVRNDLIPEATDMRDLLAGVGFTSIKIEDQPESYLASAVKL